MPNTPSGYLQSPAPKQEILRYENGRVGSIPRQSGPTPCLVLHATDVDKNIPMRGLALRHPWGPNMWYQLWDRELLQFIPLERTSYALKASPYVETNHCGNVAQVELQMKANDGFNLTDDELRNIARDILVPWHKATGVPLVGFRNGVGSDKGYGVNAPSRMSTTNWVNRTGGDYGTWSVCTHQNVPFQDHYDLPLRLHDLVWFALEILEEERKAAEPKPKPVIVLPPLPQEVPKVIHGNVDAIGSLAPGKVFVTGWAAESAEPMEIQVTVGQSKPVVLADKPRGDVGAAFPEFGSNHGYYVEVDAPGGFMVDVYVQAGNRSWSKPCYVLPDVKTVSEAPSIDVESIVDRVVTEAVADIQERLAA